jgi:hypothetical protein
VKLPLFDTLVATIDETRVPGGLEHIAQPYRLLVDARKGWAEASNALLDAAEGDALFLDDDATLTPTTLSLLAQYYDRASVFGFTLITPQGGWDRGWQVASAGMGADREGRLSHGSDVRDVMTPSYVAHVTTSAIYIKHEVIAAGVRFPVWPGAHHEDVAFTFDCWLHGFKVAYLPGLVEHPLTGAGAGATKSGQEGFSEKRAVNMFHLEEWKAEKDIVGAIAAGGIPLGRRPIDGPE